MPSTPKPIPSEVGKIGETVFISALLRRRYGVFVPVVDKGIDVVAEKFDFKKPPKYFGFQVKTSTLGQKSQSWFWYVDKYGFRCADNVYYVFVFEDSSKMPSEVNANSDFNACIIPSKEIDRDGHWTTYKGGRSFDVRITVNMLKNIPKWAMKPKNSGIALRHFNDWKKLDC